jgi:predicted peptidase
MLGATVLTALVCGGCCQVQPDVVPLFSAHEFKFGRDAKPYHYRLHEPLHAEDDGRLFPLVVWLHGQGEQGEDNIDQLEWLDRLIFLPPRSPERFPFFLVAVQCPRQARVWFRDSVPEEKRSTDMLDVTWAVVEKLLREKPIDHNRVYLAGLSAGGTACWELALRHPDIFAAVLTMGSVGTFRSRLDRIANIPIWAFHSEHDGGIEMLRDTVAAVKDAGGNVRLTEIATSDHNCWTAAFHEHHAFDWLMAQRRGRYAKAGSLPIACRLSYALAGWRWWQVPLQAAVVALPLLLVLAMVRKRGDRQDTPPRRPVSRAR